jgi:transcription initiation factor TFIID subunit TAF12
MPRGRRGGPGLLGVAVVAGGAAHVASNRANKNAQAQADAAAQDQQTQQQIDQQNQQIADLQAQQDAAAAAAAPAPAAAPAVDPTTAELQKLANLHSQGVLTDQEFAAAKAKALGI